MVLAQFEDPRGVQVPEGCDLLTSLPYPVFNKSDKWDFSLVPVEEVLSLYKSGDFRAIYKMHNDGKWSELHYCCDFHKTIVLKNVMELQQVAGKTLS